MPRKKRRQVPDLPPDEGFAWLARQQRRQSTKAANHAVSGYVSSEQRRRDELSAAAQAAFMANVAESQAIPLAERATEYVLRYDEDGQVVGIEPRS